MAVGDRSNSDCALTLAHTAHPTGGIRGDPQLLWVGSLSDHPWVFGRRRCEVQQQMCHTHDLPLLVPSALRKGKHFLPCLLYLLVLLS